jgi:hypothetical protein
LGWDPKDPLLTANFQHLLWPTGHRDIHTTLFVQPWPLLEEAVAEVGTEYVWCRDPAGAPRGHRRVDPLVFAPVEKGL